MLGHTMNSVDDLAEAIAKMKGVTVDDALKFLGGKNFANTTQANLMARGGQATKLGRMAGSRAANTALRFVPGLGIGLTALDAADIVTNDTNIGNKVMDTAAMGIGGALGAVGGPLGAATGASLGKMASDATQFVLGGGKSQEERELEAAMQLLMKRGLI